MTEGEKFIADNKELFDKAQVYADMLNIPMKGLSFCEILKNSDIPKQGLVCNSLNNKKWL